MSIQVEFGAVKSLFTAIVEAHVVQDYLDVWELGEYLYTGWDLPGVRAEFKGECWAKLVHLSESFLKLRVFHGIIGVIGRVYLSGTLQSLRKCSVGLS